MTIGHLYGILGAAIGMILANIGSVLGVGRAGQMAAGILSKDPSKFGSLLAIQLLPATQGLYGFIVAFFAFIQMNLIGGTIDPNFTTWQGLSIMGICLPIGIVGLISAIYQGKVVMAGMELMAKQEGQLGRAMTMGVLVEIFAIFSFVISLLAVMAV